MKYSENMCPVIADLEFLIGKECYNPNSYDGWNDVEGCDFRYPVNIRKSSGSFQKVKNNLNKSVLLDPNDITPQSLEYMKYKFGANELFIGKGIVNVLEYLEERYDLDFEELEKNLK